MPFSLPETIFGMTEDARKRIANVFRSRMALSLFGIALLLRLLAMFYVDMRGEGLKHGFFTYAGSEYASMAQGLLTRGDFTMELLWRNPMPSAYQPPLYPLFLAFVFRLRGLPFPAILNDSAALISVQLLHCLAGALWCACLYALGNRLFGSRIGIIAALLGATYPTLVYSVVEVHPLNFFLLLLLCFLLAACEITAGNSDAPARKGTVWKTALVLGVTAGLLALTRSECLPLCLLLLFGLGWRHPRQRVWMVCAAGICCLLYAPWLIRNHRDFGALVLTNTSGTNLFRGQGPLANGGTYQENGEEIWFTPETRNAIHALPITRDWEMRQDALLRRAALDYMRQHPLRPLQLVPNKLALFLIRDRSHPKGQSLLVWVPGLALLLCALRGYWRLRKDLRFFWPLAAVPLFYALIVIVFFSLPRYRMMIDPVLMVPAACGLCSGCVRRRPQDGNACEKPSSLTPSPKKAWEKGRRSFMRGAKYVTSFHYKDEEDKNREYITPFSQLWEKGWG